MSRNVLIIGGSRGIGAEAVRQFRALGDNVVFTYHKSELKADALRQETGAIPVRCDVRFSNSVRIAADKAQSILGYIDILICDAAIYDSTSFADTDEARWEEIINTNLSGIFFCIRNVLPLMLQRRSGRIVTVSNMWGGVEESCSVAYSAARAGVMGLTKALAGELERSGITVNCIAPDMINTDMDEIVSAVKMLTSDNAASVTGQIIRTFGE